MARYPEGHKERTRQRIIRAAAAAMRGAGIDGAAVGEVMADAGLTHGGFYAHFTSKDELVAEACAAGIREARTRLLAIARSSPPAEAVPAIVAGYLTAEERDAARCTLATLGGEIARQPALVKERFTRAFQEGVDRLAEAMPGADDAAKHDEALALLSGMVGALMLARAVADRELSDRILDVGRRAVQGGVERAGSGD